MAGQGRRYKKENFKTIKPLILVDNETIFEKSIKSLPNLKLLNNEVNQAH